MFAIILISASAFSQTKDVRVDFQNMVDDLVGLQDENINYEELYENLMQILAHPLDLNECRAEDLRQLFILNDAQINELISYRDSTGQFLSTFELQTLPSFDDATIQKLIPFVTVQKAEDNINQSLAHRITQLNNAFLISRYERTIEPRAGSTSSTNRFRGSPDKMYLRFRTGKTNDYSVGITSEKDVGEPIYLTASYPGLDFLSYHLQLKNKGRIRNLILGDYQIQFGQGLIFGGAFGLGKGGETITTVRRPNAGYIPYTSSNEAGYYRGVAATIGIAKGVTFSGYLSSPLRSGSFAEDDTTGGSISSINVSGLHRTSAELQRRHTLRENSTGATIEWTNGNLHLGMQGQYFFWDNSIRRKPSLFNQYAFNGNQHLNTGAFINYTKNNFTFFGEVAKSSGGGAAGLGGFIASLSHQFDIAVLLRSYARDYRPFYANAFGEATQPQNENGAYLGWKYRWSKKLSLMGYGDLFRFPWLGFRRYAPSLGYEWLARLNYQPMKKVTMFVQFREESKARNAASPDNFFAVEQGLRRNYAYAATVTADKLKLKTRAQFQTFTLGENTSQGSLIAFDISYDFGKLELSGRHAIFGTDDFDTRQYSYENDAWLAFSLPAYQGEGVRNVFMVEYSFTKRISLWIRYARSHFQQQEEIGSGLDRIDGNTRNDVKFQTVIRF